PRALQAQQPDDVGAVGVEVLALGCRVEPYLGAGARDAAVRNVAEQRAFRVLADWRSEVEPQPDVGQLHIVDGGLVDRESAHQYEPAPSPQRCGPRADRASQLRERKIVAGQRLAG